MINFNDEEIKDIVSELEMGMVCYIHKISGERIFVPNPLQLESDFIEDWKDAYNMLEEHPEDYWQIEPMPSREMFEFMHTYADDLKYDKRLQIRLLRALQQKHPFSKFKQEIHCSLEVRDNWLEYSNKAYEMWVRKQLNYL